MNAEAPGFIAARRDHAPAVGRTADDQRLTPVFGKIALFDGCIESIHVDVNDLSGKVRQAYGPDAG
jgi:hypothetical protein